MRAIEVERALFEAAPKAAIKGAQAMRSGDQGVLMAFKPNYNQARAERDRAKQAKKEEKLRERAEQAALRKSEKDLPSNSDEDKQA